MANNQSNNDIEIITHDLMAYKGVLILEEKPWKIRYIVIEHYLSSHYLMQRPRQHIRFIDVSEGDVSVPASSSVTMRLRVVAP